MNFKPKTKEELESFNLLTPGIYHFEVANAKDRTSKNGNEMIELNLTIYDKDGNQRNMFDYLLEAMPQKLFAFCCVTGMEQLYHQGSLRSQDCIGKTGYVDLIVSKGKENPQGGSYPDKNEVKKYTTKPVSGSKPEPQYDERNPPFIDDDLPF